MEAQVKTNKNPKNIILFCLLLLIVLCISSCNFLSNEEKKLRISGIESFENGDYQTAIESFDKALAQRSSDKIGKTEIDILRYRAEAEWKLEDYSAAANTYNILLSTDEENLEYKSMLIITLCRAGEDIDKAISLYKSIADEDITPELCNEIGMSYYKNNDYDAALEEFEKGIALAADGSTERGIEDSTDATAVYKSLSFNRACCYEQKAEYSKALELFNEYVESFGEDEAARHEIEFLKTRVN